VDQNSKTSKSHPIRIDSVSVGPKLGRVGLTFCPSKKQTDAQSGSWDRDLNEDLKAIKAFGAAALLTLMSDRELDSLGVPSRELRDKTSDLGVDWYQLPIPDAGLPDQTFEVLWTKAGLHVRNLLKSGKNIVIHCKGGLGRTGTVAARVLIELGMNPRSAIRSVRSARPGAIENKAQEHYVLRGAFTRAD
jgi:ADP-ribosyl-[dinitrogen reductase] hydrolase